MIVPSCIKVDISPEVIGFLRLVVCIGKVSLQQGLKADAGVQEMGGAQGLVKEM